MANEEGLLFSLKLHKSDAGDNYHPSSEWSGCGAGKKKGVMWVSGAAAAAAAAVGGWLLRRLDHQRDIR